MARRVFSKKYRGSFLLREVEGLGLDTLSFPSSFPLAQRNTRSKHPAYTPRHQRADVLKHLATVDYLPFVAEERVVGHLRKVLGAKFWSRYVSCRERWVDTHLMIARRCDIRTT